MTIGPSTASCCTDRAALKLSQANARKERAMEREYFVGAGIGEPPEPYCQVVRAGSLVFIAGQVALDENWQVVGAGDPLAQAEQVWRNLERAATAAGGSAADIVKITVF